MLVLARAIRWSGDGRKVAAWRDAFLGARLAMKMTTNEDDDDDEEDDDEEEEEEEEDETRS